MVDTAQTLLLIVVIVLAGLLVILGIQVYFILSELRRTIMKANKILDDAESISASIAEPVSSLSHLLTGFKTGALIASFFSKHGKKHKESGESEGE